MVEFVLFPVVGKIVMDVRRERMFLRAVVYGTTFLLVRILPPRISNADDKMVAHFARKNNVVWPCGRDHQGDPFTVRCLHDFAQRRLAYVGAIF